MLQFHDPFDSKTFIVIALKNQEFWDRIIDDKLLLPTNSYVLMKICLR